MSYVLLIEDDRDIREATLEFLAMENLEAIGFADSISALEYLTNSKNRQPTLILTDINMPKMDGPTFRARQLEIPGVRDIPCVALSADPRANQFFANLNLSGILKKPIDLDQLLAIIARFGNEKSNPSPDAPHVEIATQPLTAPLTGTLSDAQLQHDLLNELSAAKMQAELALRAPDLPSPARDQLEKIVANLSRALALSGAGAHSHKTPGSSTASKPNDISASRSVLLLDDSADLRELFAAYLSPRGFEIQTANDVEEAIVILRNGFPKLLLIDFHLGSKTVYDALDQLELSCPEVFEASKVVLFSATKETIVDARIFAYEAKAQDLRGIESVVQKYT